MLAIAVDLVVAEANAHHSKGATSVRDIRAFRVEQWSDFTDFMRTSQSGIGPACMLWKRFD